MVFFYVFKFRKPNKKIITTWKRHWISKKLQESKNSDMRLPVDLFMGKNPTENASEIEGKISQQRRAVMWCFSATVLSRWPWAKPHDLQVQTHLQSWSILGTSRLRPPEKQLIFQHLPIEIFQVIGNYFFLFFLILPSVWSTSLLLPAPSWWLRDLLLTFSKCALRLGKISTMANHEIRDQVSFQLVHCWLVWILKLNWQLDNSHHIKPVWNWILTEFQHHPQKHSLVWSSPKRIAEKNIFFKKLKRHGSNFI